MWGIAGWVIAIVMVALHLLGWKQASGVEARCRSIAFERGYVADGQPFCVREIHSPLERPEQLERAAVSR